MRPALSLLLLGFFIVGCAPAPDGPKKETKAA